MERAVALPREPHPSRSGGCRLHWQDSAFGFPSHGPSGTRPRCSCLRVAEVLALKEAAAQQGQGLPFRVSDPCATLRGRRTPALWDPVSLVRGSGTSCPLSSGWLRKVLLLVAPGAQPLAPPAHCTAGVMNLCPAAGALGTQDPFLKGQGRETCPWGAAYRADDEPAQGHSSSSQ